MNIKNPYNDILLKMRSQGAAYNPPSIDIGKVISSDPLTIQINDTPLTKKNLLVSDFLLANYKRRIKIPSTSATGSTTDGSITSIGIPDAELNFIEGLKKDDMVACLATPDGQKYIVLCKVVSL
ncbi:DUF2577 domain-containing protein [Clostridium kluyveri]|uniref:DUF2577 domain-containing protein n=1 Tax=Clostridium kluyveri TaxID=1534 RepID=A0A1L5FCJ2_CLOKL|nr:DUF2577 domain-containing protein [Clostridium kluyveri]APM40540.1 hypothetical protein BS101_18315 [Clostridium kluyveri]